MSNTILNYISLIQKSSNLSFEEERELVIKAKEGDLAAKNHLFLAYMKLVVSTAKRYVIYPLQLEDLVQQGVLGLEDVLKKFEVERNLRFSALAKHWIKAHITRYVRANMRSFSIPPDASSKILDVSRCIERLNKEIGHSPTNAEIGNELGFDESYISFLRKFLNPSVSINHPLGDNDEGGKYASIQDLIPDDRNNAKESLIRNDGIKEIKVGLTFLSEIQRKILEYRYGLVGEVKTLQEIGKEFMITSERVRQIQRAAEAKLLEWMEN